MKYLSFLIIFSFFSILYSYPKEDSLAVEFSEDTVFVCDYNAWVQCGFQLDSETSINDSIITITEIDTAGDMTTCYGFRNFRYSLVDLTPGKYIVKLYRDDLYQDVRFIDSLKFKYIVSGINEKKEIPNKYILNNAYPNPFNLKTKLRYSVPINSKIEINLYDILGRKIKTLFDKNNISGSQELTIDGSGLSSGIYFVVLVSKNIVLSKKIILLK